MSPLFYAQTDLIFCHSPVSHSMADTADVDSGYCTNSDLEDEDSDMGDSEVPSLRFSALVEQPSANRSSGTSPTRVGSGSPALLLRTSAWGT